jgi:phage baseplate assembly protein V
MIGPSYGSNDFNQTSLNLLRSGTVIDRQYGVGGPQVRVSFPDRDITSDWIPVASSMAGGVTTYSLPRIGTNVLVAHLGTGIEKGVVLGSNPTENGGAIGPGSPNSVAMLADDGFQVEYNPDTGALNVLGAKTITFAAGGDTLLYSEGNLTASVGGTANITAGTAIVKAGNIKLDGNVVVTGTLEVDGFTSCKGGGTTTPHMTNADGLSTNSC